jgi:hypothetical protein
MKTLIADKEKDLASFDSEELKSYYYEVNAKLSKNLLDGASLREQEEYIQMLNKISGELNRRKS